MVCLSVSQSVCMLWSACHSQSVCHGLPVTVTLSWSTCHSLYAMVCLSQSVCHGWSVIVNLYASVSLYLCMSWSVCHSLSLSVCCCDRSVTVSLSSTCRDQLVCIIRMSWSVCLSQSVSVSLSPTFCHFHSFCFECVFVIQVHDTLITLLYHQLHSEELHRKHTHTHACMHAHTHAHTQHTQTQQVTVCSDHFVTTLLGVRVSFSQQREVLHGFCVHFL